MDKVYSTDLTDEQWAVLQPLLPPAKRGGRPRTVDLRRILNTIFYLNKTGCQWAMLPKDLAKRSTANDYFTAWKADGTWQAILDALRRQVRVAAGHEPQPRKAAIDSQTVKGNEAGGPRGYDGGKKINGRKRHLIVDSLGLLLVVLVTSVNLDDGTTAAEVLKRLTPEHRRRLEEVRGDSKYNNRTLDRYLLERRSTMWSRWWSGLRESTGWCICRTAGSSNGPMAGRGSIAATARMTSGRRLRARP